MEQTSIDFFKKFRVLTEGDSMDKEPGDKPAYFKLYENGVVLPISNANSLEEAQKDLEDDTCVVVTKEDFKALYEAKKSKPSTGMSKKQKSDLVKSAEKGEDIGKKGKNFNKVADKAAKEYGSKEAGEKVAAAAMFKNAKR